MHDYAMTSFENPMHGSSDVIHQSCNNDEFSHLDQLENLHPGIAFFVILVKVVDVIIAGLPTVRIFSGMSGKHPDFRIKVGIPIFSPLEFQEIIPKDMSTAFCFERTFLTLSS